VSPYWFGKPAGGGRKKGGPVMFKDTNKAQQSEVEDVGVNDGDYTLGLLFIALFICCSLFINRYRVPKKKSKINDRIEDGW
jgi:hypothetical protein